MAGWKNFIGWCKNIKWNANFLPTQPFWRCILEANSNWSDLFYNVKGNHASSLTLNRLHCGAFLYLKNTVIKQINYTDHWMWRGFCFCSRIYNRLTQLQIGHNIILKVINHVSLKENYLKNLVIGSLFGNFYIRKTV